MDTCIPSETKSAIDVGGLNDWSLEILLHWRAGRSKGLGLLDIRA